MKKIKDLSALFISGLLSPPLLIPAAIYIFLVNSGYSQKQLHLNLSVIFLTELAIVGVYLFLRLTKRISDWSVAKRSERHILNISAIFILSIALIYFISLKDIALTNLLLFIIIEAGVFTVITLFWKISAHLAAVTLFSLTLFIYYPDEIYLSILLIVLTSWARIYRKRHTFLQAAGGIFLTIGIYLVYRTCNKTVILNLFQNLN